MTESQLVFNIVAFISAAQSAKTEAEQQMAVEAVRSHLNAYITVAVKAAVEVAMRAQAPCPPQPHDAGWSAR